MPLLIRVESTLCLNLKRIFSLPYEAVNHRVIICTYLGLCRYIQASSTPKKAIVSSTPGLSAVPLGEPGWLVCICSTMLFLPSTLETYVRWYLLTLSTYHYLPCVGDQRPTPTNTPSNNIQTIEHGTHCK